MEVRSCSEKIGCYLPNWTPSFIENLASTFAQHMHLSLYKHSFPVASALKWQKYYKVLRKVHYSRAYKCHLTKSNFLDRMYEIHLLVWRKNKNLQEKSLTYLLTPRSRVLLEKLTGSAASQGIPRIFGTRRFLTVPTSARHLSLSWANSIQFPQLPPTSCRSILILSSHLRLVLPSGLFPSGFPARTLYIRNLRTRHAVVTGIHL